MANDLEKTLKDALTLIGTHVSSDPGYQQTLQKLTAEWDALHVTLDSDAASKAEKDDAKRRELYNECQRILSDEGGLIAPVWADFLDAKASKVGTPEEISGDWDLDGNRCGERWWFNA